MLAHISLLRDVRSAHGFDWLLRDQRAAPSCEGTT